MNDADRITAVARAIQATNHFATVDAGRWPARLPGELNAGQGPRAWVRPTGWSTTTADQGGSAEARVRTLKLEVRITARADEGPDLQALIDAAEAAIEGQPLDGCDNLPGLTRLEEGRYLDTPNTAEQVVSLAGQLAYLIGDGAGFTPRDGSVYFAPEYWG